MASMATVTTRPSARSAAKLPPAKSICDRVQPPKTLPPAFASAGMAMARSCGPPGTVGGWSAMVALPSAGRARRSAQGAVDRGQDRLFGAAVFPAAGQLDPDRTGPAAGRADDTEAISREIGRAHV